jgi:type IV pilus assembly protein PilQ
MKSSQMFKVVFWVFLLFLANSCATTPTLVQTPQPDTTAQDVKVSIIQRISYIEEQNYTRILIEGSETIAPPFYNLLSDPLRIAIDVPHIDLKQIKEPVRIDNGTIGEIFVTQYDDKGRIEIGLVKMANYNISKEDKNLVIDIEKVKEIPEVKEGKKEEEIVKEKEIEISMGELKKEDTLPTQPVTTAPASETVKKGKEIVDVSLEQKKDFITFNIMADGKLENYDFFKLDSPPRLVLDIWGVGTRYPKKSIKIKNPFIKEVRIGQHPDKLRVVFDSLKSQLPPYQINRMDDKLIVSLGNVPQPSEPQILLQEKATEGVTPPKVKGVQALSPKAQEQTPPTSEGLDKTVKANTLTEIDFKQMDHKSRIIVALTGEPQFKSYTISKGMIAVDIKNASVPKHLQRRLDTSGFESAVNYINVQNVKTGKANDVRILIKLREEVPFETAKEGRVLFIDIEKPKKIEAKIETVPMPKKEGVTIETKKEETQREEEKAPPELKKEEKVLPAVEEKPIPKPQVTKKVEEEKKASEEGLSEKIYTGRKLSLDFKDADIKNILRLIAEVSNLNIITGDDVTGKITMRLVDVPWDQALDVILQARSLGMSRVGNVVRVAPLDSLKKEIQAELEAKRVRERLEDLVTELIPVNYATAKEIIPQVKSILSDRGDVKVDDRTNILIVKDVPRNISGVKNLVKFLDKRTPQVLIEARIIEANLTFQEELGVSWGFLTSTGTGQNKTFKVGGGTPGSILGTTTNTVVNLPAQPKAGSGAPGILEFLFTSTYGLKELDIAISAHENKGDVRIISSPKIATLDNKEASVEQGLRIPYKKITTEGTVSVDFIEANLKLIVKPHVTNDGNIKMEIRVKKDAPDFSVVVESTPSIDKKEAITEVLVKDGGVVVIAGIYTIEKTEGTEGIPLFSKIPLLGWFFKREAKEDKRKDLLIFISPKIVKEET